MDLRGAKKVPLMIGSTPTYPCFPTRPKYPSAVDIATYLVASRGAATPALQFVR